MTQQSILAVELFYVWGIDFMGPFDVPLSGMYLAKRSLDSSSRCSGGIRTIS
ncbi:unnamed protein product [Rhodiola kirilowii]